MILLEAETFSTLLHDTAHWEFELFVGFIEAIIIDLVFGALIWNKYLKPYLAKRKTEIIKQEHDLHNITEDHH